MIIMEIKGLKKDYALGKTTVNAIRGIDLSTEKSDFLSIIGPKKTFFRYWKK